MTLVRVLIAVAALSAVSSAVAQPSVPRAGETLEVSIVNVDVFVTDKNGDRVRGLTKDDFEIREAGKPQPISNFAEYSSAAEGGATQVEAPPPQPRTIVVFLERMRLLPFQARPFVDAMKETLRALVRDGDSVSYVLWSPTNTNQIPFTSDLDPIGTALDSFSRSSTAAQFDDAERLSEEVAAVRDFERKVAARIARAGGGTGQPENPFGGTSAASLQMLQAMLEMQMRVAAINSTLDTMAAAEGKKILILGTRRLGAVAGAEFAFASSGSLRLDTDVRNRYGTEELIDSIVDNANSAGVTIYPIHPMRDEGATLSNEIPNLAMIAEKTGGLSAWSTADVVKLLPRIVSDASDYYSLAYRVTPSGKDQRREIVVTTRNPDWTVRSRREFVEKSESARMKDRLNGALFGAVADQAIPLEVKLGRRAKKARNRTTIPVSVRVPIRALTPLPQDEAKLAGAFSVYVGTAYDLDEISDVTQKTQPFELQRSDMEEAAGGHFTYDLDVVVNDKARYVAVGVLDEVSKAWGVVRVDLKATVAEPAMR